MAEVQRRKEPQKEPPQPHPLARVPGRRGEHQVEAVTDEAAQEVARQAKVALEMAGVVRILRGHPAVEREVFGLRLERFSAEFAG